MMNTENEEKKTEPINFINYEENNNEPILTFINHEEKITEPINCQSQGFDTGLKDVTYFDTLYIRSDVDVDEMEKFGKSHHECVIEAVKNVSSSWVNTKISEQMADYIQYMQHRHGMFDGLIINEWRESFYVKREENKHDVALIPKDKEYAIEILRDMKQTDKFYFKAENTDMWKMHSLQSVTDEFVTFKSDHGTFTVFYTENFLEYVMMGRIKKIPPALKHLCERI